MFKKILMTTLALVIVSAAAASLYHTTLAKTQPVQPALNIPLAGQSQAGVAAADTNGSSSAAVQAAPAVGAQADAGLAYGQSNRYGATASDGTPQPGGNGSADGSGVPNPQNGLTEWLSYSGVVLSYAPPSLELQTADGQVIMAEVGSSSYVTSLGLALQPGDALTVVGFWDANGGLALRSLTVQNSGQTFSFRDEYASPLWSGGRGGQRGQGGQGGQGYGQTQATP